MLEEFDIFSPDEIAASYLCNIFGGMLNTRSAINIGMLPSILENNIFGVGNSVLHGANTLLCSPRARANAEHIRTYARVFTPANNYDECIAASMEFRRY